MTRGKSEVRATQTSAPTSGGDDQVQGQAARVTKRVLITSYPYLPNRSGVPIVTETMAGGLAQRGWNVTIFTDTPSNSTSHVADTFRIVRSRSLFALARTIRQTDAVIMNGGVSRKVAVLAGLHAKPLIAWHQMASVESTQTGWRRLANNPLHWAVSLNVGVSKHALATRAEGNGLVVYNPAPDCIALRQVTRDQSERDIDFLFVGRLIEGKGVLLLADALRVLDTHERDCEVVFVGKGDCLAKVVSQCERLEHVRVRWLGQLGSPDLATIYNRSKFLVLPTTTHAAGLPLVVAEAFSSGIPCIVSDRVELVEAIADCGWTFENGNIHALVHALKRALTCCNWEELSRRAQLLYESTYTQRQFIDGVELALRSVGIDCERE